MSEIASRERVKQISRQCLVLTLSPEFDVGGTWIGASHSFHPLITLASKETKQMKRTPVSLFNGDSIEMSLGVVIKICVSKEIPCDEDEEVVCVESGQPRPLEEEKKSQFCLCCEEKPANFIFNKCGHIHVCKTCYIKCKACPICRGKKDKRNDKQVFTR